MGTDSPSSPGFRRARTAAITGRHGLDSDVRYETDGPLALVTLDRPRYRNAQSWRLLDELDVALDRAQADRAIAAVVVRGEGEHFSAGHDLGTPEQIEDYKARGDPAGRHRGVRGVPPLQPRPHAQVAQPAQAHHRHGARLLHLRRLDDRRGDGRDLRLARRALPGGAGRVLLDPVRRRLPQGQGALVREPLHRRRGGAPARLREPRDSRRTTSSARRSPGRGASPSRATARCGSPSSR